jgi:drug/metabolite transporter (DMT)-like permease
MTAGQQSYTNSRPGTWRITALTAGALTGFSANSLLTRLALSAGDIDAATFTTIRIVSGAVTLAFVAGRGRVGRAGSWVSAAALAAYAVAFTFAYLRIGAGMGALLLFGSVQATMIGWGLARGERPGVHAWAGLAIALAGLLVLGAPGLTAPDTLGAILMLAAGVAWGVYSLRGRLVPNPLQATAANFIRAVPLTLAATLPFVASAGASPRGVLLAIASGSVTSGLAYTMWYAALPSLTAWKAAVVQLSVPVVTAAGAVALLGETVTLRLWIAGAAILGGVIVSISTPRRRT